MTARRVTCAVLGLACTWSVQRSALADDWPQLGLDGARERSSAEIAGATFQSAWQARVSTGAIVASPTVADGYVVVAGSQGELAALHAADGTPAWHTSAGGTVNASPAIDHGRVFVPTLEGQVVAVGLASGQALWSRQLGGQNFGSPVISGDSLVLSAGSPDQKVVRLASATGATQWETAPGAIADVIASSAAVTGNYALVGMNGGRYQSVKLATGETAWTVDTIGSVGLSSPLVVGATAYLMPGGRAAGLYAVDAASGRVLDGWPVSLVDPSAPAAGSYQAQRFAVSSPVSLGGLVAVTIRFDYDMRADVDGQPGLHVLREYVAAVDPQSARVAFMAPLGELDVSSINDVPAMGLAPTPAVFASADGPLLAAASSVSPNLRVLDAGGNLLSTFALSGATRSSPVFANGMLFVATDAGVVHALQSTVNHAPPAVALGFAPANGEVVNEPAVVLRWTAVSDADGEPVRYQVRVGTGGDLLQGWQTQLDVTDPQASVPLATLQAGASYLYAVRARDARGAWSPWSATQTFQVAGAPTVKIAAMTYDSLEQAIGAATPGSIINLGTGVLHLAAPVSLPHGVSLVGMGADHTFLDATGLAAGVQVHGQPGEPMSVRSVTISGAGIGVQVMDGDQITVRNVVLHDNATAGVQVEAGAAAQVINATLAGNGTGAVAHGTLAVRNSIVTGNDIGFARDTYASFESRYNDVVANVLIGYRGLVPGTGDMSAVVTFRSVARKDFHIDGPETTTDHGDPGDDFALEPLPNGGRVNMGAFGGTTQAEVSALASTERPVPAPTVNESGEAGGCTVAARAVHRRSALASSLLVAALVVLTRRRRRAGGR